MAIQLTPADILTIWNNSATDRTLQAERAEYYAGQQAICDETVERYDGQDRNLVVTNWVRYIVNKHVGFLTSKPIRYTAREGQEPEALVNLDAISRYNYLNAIDVEHLRNAILAEFGVEVHGFDGEQIEITGYPPHNWAFLEDADGNILAAVYCATLPIGTWWQDKILIAELDVYTCYTDTEIITLTLVTQNASVPVQGIPTSTPGATAAALQIVGEPVKHEYGCVPVIRMAVSADRTAFIDNAFITQQDVFNETRSRNADDVEYNVDALLKIIGYAPDAMTQVDTDGKTFLEKMREHRILPLKEGGEAEFLTKGNEYTKAEFDLNLTRDAIHLMGSVADTEAIAGATGATSGIALKLKLQPQIAQAGVFTSYFEQGIRERIDLINIIWAAQGKPLLEDYDVSFSLQIPINEQEIWQGLPYLDPYLTKEDILKLIPSVEDPAAAAEAKQAELDANTPTFESLNPVGEIDEEDETETPTEEDNVNA